MPGLAREEGAGGQPGPREPLARAGRARGGRGQGRKKHGCRGRGSPAPKNVPTFAHSGSPCSGRSPDPEGLECVLRGVLGFVPERQE